MVVSRHDGFLIFRAWLFTGEATGALHCRTESETSCGRNLVLGRRQTTVAPQPVLQVGLR